MKLSDTIPIAFSVGSYGTYLEWVLTTLCTDQPTDPPFTVTGSSHAFLGNHVENNAGWQKYLQGNQPKQFVRFHPKEHETQSLSQNLDQVLADVDRMIYIYPDPNSVLLVINNWLSKVRQDWWAHDIIGHQGIEKIHSQWPACAGLTADEIPVWVRREFLSFYLMPSWYDQVEWYHPDSWQRDRCITITVSELLFDFESCLSRLQNFTCLDFQKTLEQIRPYHQTMLDMQKYLNQDLLCRQIVEATVHDRMFDWTGQDMPLPSQSWIQWQLRNSGWELHCDGLDIWPTNSVHLKQLLYPTNQ
jgi:hypothetical protein